MTDSAFEMDDKLQKEENLTKEVDNPVKSPSKPPECLVCATTSPEIAFIYTSRTKYGTAILDFVQKFIKPGWKPKNHPKCVTICKLCLDLVNKLEEIHCKFKIHGDESTDSDSDCELSKEASNIQPAKRFKKESSNNSVSKIELSFGNGSNVIPEEDGKELKVEDDTLTQDLKGERDKAEGNVLYSCETCKREYFRFSYGRDLIKENRSDAPLDCSICQRIFIPKPSKHRKPVTDKKPFGCMICRCRFSQEIYLEQHLKYHTSQLPYQCHACDLKFHKRPHLKGHLKDCKPCVCGVKCYQFMVFE